jgi:acyl carrier protein
MATQYDETLQTVRTAIAGVLQIQADDVPPDAALIEELDVDSLDLLEIMFQLERSLRVQLAVGDIPRYVQGDIDPDEFYDAAGNLTSAARRQLAAVMPQLDLGEVSHPLDESALMQRFTVENLAAMVDRKLSEMVARSA